MPVPLTPVEVAAGLSCWRTTVSPEPLGGGITNTNFVVRDSDETFVVRIGDDLPVHGIVRSHELATCVAAHACGLSPEIVHHEPGALVMRYIDAATLTADNIGEPATLTRVADLVRRCHAEMPRHLPSASLMFWVFQTCRSYLKTAAAAPSRLADALATLDDQNTRLEAMVDPIRPVFCHNDLLAANILDDGSTLWLLDWEYAGWNSTYFDLANLASNNELSAAQEVSMIEAYFERPADEADIDALHTMKCASLLREGLWSLAQEQHSTLDFDYESYTDTHLDRFRTAFDQLSKNR